MLPEHVFFAQPLPEHPLALWLTGLPAAGKTTLARALVDALSARQRPARLIDGDDLRSGPHQDLGFTREDRAEQSRRIATLAIQSLEAGEWPVIATVSPYRSDRAHALHRIGRALEIHVATPLATCIARDSKGVYAAARRGERTQVTGIDDPYEVPDGPDITIAGNEKSIAAEVAKVFAVLTELTHGASS